MARYWQPKHLCTCAACGWRGKRTNRMMFKPCPMCGHYPIKKNGGNQMTTAPDKIAHADERGSYWLAKANQASERGEHEKAEKLYEKGQKWLDLSNKLMGWQ